MESSAAADAFSVRIANATMPLVKTLADTLSQSEKNATVEIGVVIGMATSALVLSLIYVAKLCIVRINKPSNAPMKSDVSTESQTEACEEKDEDCENAPATGTEGAYRSDSDSDDDGQGTRVAKEAQKRARKSNGV